MAVKKRGRSLSDTKKSNLKLRAWKIFSRIVRKTEADSNGYVSCVTCGETGDWKEFHAGHFIPKSAGISVYFEWTNVHVQCPTCNYYGGEAVKARYTLWMIDKYGRDEVERLDNLRHQKRHMTKTDYLKFIQELKLKDEAEL